MLTGKKQAALISALTFDIFSSFVDTVQVLRNVSPGRTINYFARPAGEISHVLTDTSSQNTMPTVQLWWSDMPVFGLSTMHDRDDPLSKLFDHTRSHRAASTLVLTVRRNCFDKRSRSSRAACGIHFNQALKPCVHTHNTLHMSSWFH